jgi:hypothetical protein
MTLQAEGIQRQDRLHTETLAHTHTHTVETLVSVEFFLIVMPVD